MAELEELDAITARIRELEARAVELERQMAVHAARAPAPGPSRAQRRAYERWRRKADELEAEAERLKAEFETLKARGRQIIEHYQKAR